MRDSLRTALVALERVGCDAAGYRLTGSMVERLCVVHLYGRWRLLLAFPEPDLAVIIDIAQHGADNDGDIYARLYEVLGMTPPAGLRDKPPCCDAAGTPPEATELIDQMTRAYRRLTRRR